MNFTVDISDLTPCQRKYTEQHVLGHTKKEISQIFFRSEKTIENTIHNVYEKTGCRNATELASWFWSRLVNATIDVSQPKRKIIMTAFFLALVISMEFSPINPDLRARRSRRGKDEYEFVCENFDFTEPNPIPVL
jgi:DNA-binding CsgD family transcriptional regulator